MKITERKRRKKGRNIRKEKDKDIEGNTYSGAPDVFARASKTLNNLPCFGLTQDKLVHVLGYPIKKKGIYCIVR